MKKPARTSQVRPTQAQPAFHKEESPFYWIARVNGEYTKALERALKQADCDIPTWRILAILHDGGTLSVSEIATHAVVKLPTTTRAIHRIKKAGLVTTSVSPDDARVSLVSLTRAGEKALQNILEITTDLLERSITQLNPATVKRLNELLQVLLANFLQQHAE